MHDFIGWMWLKITSSFDGRWTAKIEELGKGMGAKE